MNVEKVILGLPDKDRRALEITAKNAFDKVCASPANKDASELLKATDAEFIRRFGVVNGWSRTEHGEPRLRQFGGELVASVRRTVTHKSHRKEVWIIEIRGRRYPDLFHHVNDAREFVEKILSGEELH